MCSRGELRQLLEELLFSVDQVAYLGARTQFSDECNKFKLNGTENKTQFGSGNVHFECILRFHRAYIRYFVFAADPYTEFIVPLTSSSLSLFITNILSQDGPTESPVDYHTSRTIIEFLQITQCHVVQRLLSHYKTDLMQVIKDQHLPFNIEVLTKIRHDCYQEHFSNPNSLQNNQVHQIAAEAKLIFQQIPRTVHYQTVKQMNIGEDFIFQIPIDGNISIVQPTIGEHIFNYTPITHTVQTDVAETFVQNIDSTTPLYIVGPVSIQIPSNENTIPPPVIEVPSQNGITNETMTMDIGKAESINTVTGTANPSQISNHQLCAGCNKPIQDRYLLKALDLLWHEDCLKCGCCDCRLGEVGSTLYTKGTLMLCKRDYLRLFGNTGMCAACNKTIPAFEMVMRARNNVYHLECFACQQCNHRFCVGDRFYLCENKILCEYDYEERLVFASIGNHPMLKRHATSVAQNPPPPYTKNNPGNMPNGNGPMQQQQQQQQQVMAMDQNQHQHQHQHIQQTKMHHDDHNNNHGPANGSCGITANQFNAQLMKIPHSA